MVLTQFEFRPYERSFLPPLQTSHGTWKVRQGIIVRLSDAEGRVSFGEIAPLAWFGSESFEAAIAFCESLPTEIDQRWIDSIPRDLPACQFGLESAWYSHSAIEVDCSGLLPAGERACDVWESLWQQGYRTFKWKIGVGAIADELALLNQLITVLPKTVKLRLDANAGLSLSQAKQWLEHCESLSQIEFLEQPLEVDAFDQMLTLSRSYQTAIALDESVATLEQLKQCYTAGWRGIYVIKPAIAGSPSQLQHFCQQQQLDTVFSSVFETAIGRQAGLQLASKLSKRAAGYGTTHWFRDLITKDFNQLWESL